MKPRVLACLAIALVPTALPAAPADAVIVAAMRLSDQPNYGWVTTVVDDARTYEVHGSTVKGGFTRVKTPVVNAVRRRLGRSVTDTQVELFFKGNVKCVIDTEDGWKTVDELPPPEPREPEVHAASALTRRTGHKAPPPTHDEVDIRKYSNLQLAICHPHEELGVIVTSHTDLKVEGGVASGSLNDLGAQLLLVHDGQTEITPLRATGTFKLWLRGGMVTRYQVALDGVLAVNTSAGRREVSVRQTMDTILKEVGTTKFDVPEEAARKLSR